MQKSVFYEVEALVEREIAADYKSWLENEHVQEVLACPGFQGAQLFADEDSDQIHTQPPVRIRVVYTLESMEALEGYLHNHAPKLRQKGIEKFQNRFQASRRIWRTHQWVPRS